MAHGPWRFVLFLVVLCSTTDVDADMPVVLKGRRGFFEKNYHSVNDIVVSPDGKLLFSIDSGGIVRLWDLEKRKILHQITCKVGTQSVAVSPQGDRFLSAGTQGGIGLRDVRTGKEIYVIPGMAQHIQFAADGKRCYFAGAVAGASPANFLSVIRICDAATGSEIRNFTIPLSNQVAFSPDGKRAVSIDVGSFSNQSLAVWDMATGKDVLQLDGHAIGERGAVAWSPNGQHILSCGNDKTAIFWDATTGMRLHTIEIGRKCFAAGFSPDGKHALVGCGIHTVKRGKKSKPTGIMILLETATGRMLREFVTEGSRVTSVAFSSNGLFAIAGAADEKIYLWDISH